jgi:hypothetical protein
MQKEITADSTSIIQRGVLYSLNYYIKLMRKKSISNNN